jgi:predicted porin
LLATAKSLVALAALAATSAFAQSTVALTGAVDVSYAARELTALNGGSLGKSTGVSEGQNTANRLNFLMTEDLGGGLKAGAMVETGMNITNGALLSSRAAAAGIQYPNSSAAATQAEIPTASYSTATNRQSYVFANGSFGEIRAGFTRTNLYEQSTFSGFLVGQEQYGSLLHTIGNSTFGGTRGNGLTWISPVMNGFKLTLQKGSGGDRESTTVDANATNTGLNGVNEATVKRTGVKLDYANGPLALAYGHTDTTAITTYGSSAATTGVYNVFNGVAGLSAIANTNYKSKLDQLTGSYTIGDLKLTAQYLNGKRDSAAILNPTNTSADTYHAANSTTNYKATVLGGLYTMGNWSFWANNGSGSIAFADRSTKLNDIKQTQYGVRYALSKRTTLYAMQGTSKDSGTTVAATASSGTSANGVTGVAKATVTGVGMAHSF